MQSTQEMAHKQLPLASQQEAVKRISVSSEFDTLNAVDMLHGYMLLRAGKSFQGVSERYANALSHKINQDGIAAIKADELSYSTQTGFGDEWVPELWSAQIWQKARQDNTILPLFRSIEMPSNPFDLPIEGTDPTVYFVPETTAESHLSLGSGNTIPDSKIGSGNVQLVAKKLALRVGFSSELVEDAILPVLNIYREQAMRAIADSIDHLLLNGDTETAATGNINTDDAAATGTDRFLAFNGLRKLPLVTNTANKVDMGNVAPTLTKLRDARFAMEAKYSARPQDLAWIVDGGTYAQLLSLSEFLTMDKAGALATAQTGQIGFVDGIPVLVSGESAANHGLMARSTRRLRTNDPCTAVCVYPPWAGSGLPSSDCY
ncbi:MAG: phage major capsid protein [Anaerolineae bacterium]|nr:phage major capsid protein [Anaerolineae bacterium]